MIPSGRLSTITCFNPCFVGSSSQAQRRYPLDYERTEFQSLFCWKFLLGNAQGSATVTCAGFNPCFVGSSSQANIDDSGREVMVLFQSLFCWKFLLGLEKSALGKGLQLCFNPCFVGSSSQAEKESLSNALKEMFQSLFCWKFLLGLGYFNVILFFQSVSILVLLEVPLRRNEISLIQPLVFCFNPCFVGSSSQAIPHRSSKSISSSFNPCFVGSSSQAFHYRF